MERHAIVEQSLVACRNILGLSKTYTPALLERACAKANATGALPSYIGLKNAILAMRVADACGQASHAVPDKLADRAKLAGRLCGADAYKRGDERDVDRRGLRAVQAVQDKGDGRQAARDGRWRCP